MYYATSCRTQVERNTWFYISGNAQYLIHKMQKFILRFTAVHLPEQECNCLLFFRF